MKQHLSRILSASPHFWLSMLIVIVVSAALTAQITDRRNFASSELHQDVVERWGAPIRQAAPTVRYVASGTVFNELSALPLSSQHVALDATMNYRKRGLVYFSGFDFGFTGDYVAENQQGRDIDAVFVFPVSLDKNQVLLSDLVFTVNGKRASVDLRDGDKLVWTGRLAPGERAQFHVAFRGRGLDSFVYVPDPGMPVRDFKLDARIHGGDNYDYPEGVVPAMSSTIAEDSVDLGWSYGSLESGVPVGVILPSEQAYDGLIGTLVQRCWAPFILLFFGLSLLCLKAQKPLRFYEAYLIAAGYSLFFILTAYLAAFMHFYLALPLSLLVVGAVLTLYVRSLLGAWVTRYFLGMLAAFVLVPTLAVVLQGYTGLIYTLELLGLVATLMILTTRASVRAQIDTALQPTVS